MDIDQLASRFTFKDNSRFDNAEAHARVREGAFTIAREYLAFVPAGRERDIAIMKLEESLFWANAGIARGTDEAHGLCGCPTKPMPAETAEVFED